MKRRFNDCRKRTLMAMCVLVAHLLCASIAMAQGGTGMGTRTTDNATRAKKNKPPRKGPPKKPLATRYVTRPCSPNTTVDADSSPNEYRPQNFAVASLSQRVPEDGKTKNGWTNSGIIVHYGQRLRITASGRISLGGGCISTPAGIAPLPKWPRLTQGYPAGALIAVIGDDNNDFIFIGRSRDFVAQRTGVLFLGINEDNLEDNSGAYDVVIEVGKMNLNP